MHYIHPTSLPIFIRLAVVMLVLFIVWMTPLLAIAADRFVTDLSYGLKENQDVAALQQLLSTQGFYNGPITGNYLEQTQEAVADFQRAHRIEPAAGYFGPQTRTIANDLFASTQLAQLGAAAPREKTPTWILVIVGAMLLGIVGVVILAFGFFLNLALFCAGLYGVYYGIASDTWGWSILGGLGVLVGGFNVFFGEGGYSYSSSRDSSTSSTSTSDSDRHSSSHPSDESSDMSDEHLGYPGIGKGARYATRREDILGNHYTEDDKGNVTREREDIFGNKVYEGSDGSITREREDIFGNRIFRGDDGTVTREKEDMFGNKYLEDDKGNVTREREDIFGNKYYE